TWNENWVWVAQDRMLSGIIGCQGICINPVLSSWLEVNLPPIPPSFTHDKHVFLLRTASGELAALQLQNYMNAAGTKCHLTINYRFPL
ncbi:MAG: HmuY family protein, partial [Bacteroidales bacterium]|nr:HmuY family protein [Candidatus Physcousia equi]